jgi:thiamine biosynthesis lipoprotein
VATSGTSERWAQVDGRRLGHILDPRTGRPAPAWGSVTVVHPDPLVADILSTALYVMGPDEGLRWLDDHPGIAALFLDVRDETVIPRWTGAMERWLAPDARLSGGTGVPHP